VLIQVIAATLDVVEESPCSHGSEMTVVFVLGERISRGFALRALTAGINPKSSDMDEVP
jgi:hypothetical protein